MIYEVEKRKAKKVCDISFIDESEFTASQLKEIYGGIAEGLDVTGYAQKGISLSYMRKTRACLLREKSVRERYCTDNERAS